MGTTVLVYSVKNGCDIVMKITEKLPPPRTQPGPPVVFLLAHHAHPSRAKSQHHTQDHQSDDCISHSFSPPGCFMYVVIDYRIKMTQDLGTSRDYAVDEKEKRCYRLI